MVNTFRVVLKFFILFFMVSAFSETKDVFPHSCNQHELNIPNSYIIGSSIFSSLDGVKGLDTDECTTRLKFTDLLFSVKGDFISIPKFTTIISGYNENNGLSINHITTESNALLRLGEFQGALYIKDIFPGYIAVFTEKLSPIGIAHLFQEGKDNRLNLIGTCQGASAFLKTCRFTYRFKGIKFEFSLNNQQNTPILYEKIIELLESKVDEWSK